MLEPTALGLFSDDAEALRYGLIRMWGRRTLSGAHGSLRDPRFRHAPRGVVSDPMLIVVAGACVLRVVWVLAVFQLNPDHCFLTAAYPVTYAVTAAVMLEALRAVRKRAYSAAPKPVRGCRAADLTS